MIMNAEVRDVSSPSHLWTQESSYIQMQDVQTVDCMHILSRLNKLLKKGTPQ